MIVAAFDGWIDAAGASTAAAERVADGADLIAGFDADVLFDFRSRRPVLDVVDGRLEHLTWPELTLTRSHRDRRDLLVLTGAEPDFRWQELGRDLVDLSKRLGVTQWVSLGSIPTAVPHTRPVPVLATASAGGLLAEDEQVGPAGLLRVPSAALSTLEMAAADAGIPAVGFYAQVPHYVGGAPGPPPRRGPAARRPARRRNGTARAAGPDRPGRRRLADLRRAPRVGGRQSGAADAR